MYEPTTEDGRITTVQSEDITTRVYEPTAHSTTISAEPEQTTTEVEEEKHPRGSQIADNIRVMFEFLCPAPCMEIETSQFRAHQYHIHIFPFPINWKFKEPT